MRLEFDAGRVCVCACNVTASQRSAKLAVTSRHSRRDTEPQHTHTRAHRASTEMLAQTRKPHSRATAPNSLPDRAKLSFMIYVYLFYCEVNGSCHKQKIECCALGSGPAAPCVAAPLALPVCLGSPLCLVACTMDNLYIFK